VRRPILGSPRRARRTSSPGGPGFDYVVVGAGSAGCALAYRLGQQRDARVLVLEAGARDSSPYLRIPAGRVRMSDRYDWGYPSEPDASRMNNTESWEAGRVLGGTSAINGMFWSRGAPSDYDDWARRGCTGWDFASVLPYFKRAETFEGGPSELRGGAGPQAVSFVRVRHPLTDQFVAAAQRAGFPFNPDYNGADPYGVAFSQVSQRRGLRHSTGRAYLSRRMRPTNVTVRLNAQARRVVLRGSRAVGVEYDHRGRTCTAWCDGEVVVSSGAFGSPKLLLLSGIGPGASLAALGIDVAVDLPGVGTNLQNHLGVSLTHQVAVPTLNREISPWNVVRHGLALVLAGRGAATAPYGHAVLFGGVDPDTDAVDFEATFSPFGRFARKENGRSRTKTRIVRENAVTTRVTLCHTRSRGRVWLRSADPHAAPGIHHELASDPRDIQDLADACRVVRRVLYSEPLGDQIVRELTPGEGVRDADAWEGFIRKTSGSKHAAGTCTMGVDDDAVVDPRLRVRGVVGLRVADLSVVPNIPSGNTNAAAVMIGERAADLVLADAGRDG
jgi:choline dehydrogenase